MRYLPAFASGKTTCAALRDGVLMLQLAIMARESRHWLALLALKVCFAGDDVGSSGMRVLLY